MAGTAHRQKFRKPLDNSQNHGVKKLMVILIYCLFVCFSYIKILLYHKNTGDTISRLSFRMKI